MADAQNERTNSSGRRRGRRSQRESSAREPVTERIESPAPIPQTPVEKVPARFERPDDIVAPTVPMEVYCTHHMAMLPEHEPMQVRTNMATLRHLPVDRFGAATLFCDCLHNGPHEWPPTMQRLETAVELDQFINASSSET